MKKIFLFMAALLIAPQASAQSANWIPGPWTLAPGPDSIYQLPASGYCYNVAWATDRPGGAGLVVSNCVDWVSDQGVQGDTGPQGPQGPKGNTGSAGPQGVPGATGATGMQGTQGNPGATGATGATGMQGVQGNTGATGSAGTAATISVGTVTTGTPGSSVSISNAGTSGAAVFNFTIPRGNTGATGPSTVGSYNSRAVALATAYQATDTTKPAIVTINLASTATISLSGGTTNTAEVVVGSTNAVAAGTGTQICRYTNSNTGALTLGLNLSTVATTTCTINLPIGWYFAVRQTSGTVSVTSTFDQTLG